MNFIAEELVHILTVTITKQSLHVSHVPPCYKGCVLKRNGWWCKKILRSVVICIYCILMTNAMHLITVYNVCIIFILFCLQMISSLGVSKAVLDNVIFCHQEESNWWVLDYCYEQISVSLSTCIGSWWALPNNYII